MDNNNLEFIVGIPSYMEADNIANVVKTIDEGINKYFGDLNSIIVNVDNHSEDGTGDIFKTIKTKTPKKYISTRKGILGKGNNFYNLFKFAQGHFSTLKAVLVIDADLKSITPEWIKYLGEPVLKGFDYAFPFYSRHQFDGTITNHICYPLIYGLLGEDIRQPIGGEFGFSSRLINHWLEQRWLPSTKQYGIDIFMSLEAILGKYKICEVGLGTKVHKASSPKIGPMFTQVVTTFFNKILSYRSEWLNSAGFKPKTQPRFGLKKIDPPQELKIDIRELKEKLRQEYYEKEPLLRKYLNEYSMSRVENMFEQDFYNMGILMWTQIVYQLLFTFDMGGKKIKEEVVEALKPLYFVRSIAFDYQAWRYNINYAESTIKEQARAFSSQKPYLIGLYRKEDYEKFCKV
ncbi:MAG: glycosyltransferase [Spirochaetota bacterium]|nr:glycosyltransferase [Spirochaetota bacterium]